MNPSLRLLALFAALGTGSAFAQTTYNVAASFANNALWTDAATWFPSTGTPGASDSITIDGTNSFASGNAISINGASRAITNFSYDYFRSFKFNQNGTFTAGLEVQVNGTFVKTNTGLVEFAEIGLGGSGTSIDLRNGGVGFIAGSNTGVNLNTFTLSKTVNFNSPGSGDVPELRIRAAGNKTATLNVTGAVNLQTANATRAATFALQEGNSASAIMNLQGNFTGALVGKEITVLLNQGSSAFRSELNFAATGTNSYTASAGSKIVFGRLNSAGQNAISDLTSARSDGFGAVDIIQLGDSTNALNGGTANLRVLGTADGVTIGQKINVNGYTVTSGSETYTLGGTHASGLVSFTGPVTLARAVTLLANTADATTAFTGGFTAGANAISVTGAGITAMSNTLTGTSTLTVASGATLTPGSTGSDIGTLAFSGGQDLTFASGSNALLHVASSASYDRFTGVDALGYGGAASVSFGATLSGDAVLDLFDFSGSATGAFDSISISGAYTATLNAGNGFTSTDLGSNTFAFNHSTGDLTFTAIPEPSSFAALAGLAGLGLAALRRRRA